MGLDLTLLPFDTDPRAGISFSHTVLSPGRSFAHAVREAVDAGELKTFDVPRDFSSYVCRGNDGSGVHYDLTLEDSYGIPLKWAHAMDVALVWLSSDECKREESASGGWKYRAVRAYLASLEPSTPVALYWC